MRQKMEYRRDRQEKRSARREWKEYREIMRMTGQERAKRRAAHQLVLPLLITLLGVAGSLAIFFLKGGFQPVELVLMFILTAFGAWGYMQCTIRGIMTVFFLYIATSLAATFYVITAPYVGAPFYVIPALYVGASFSYKVTPDILALSFVVLTVVTWVTLEFIWRQFFKDMSLPALGFLDNLGGFCVYFVVGILVVSLLFNAMGYSDKFRDAHDRAFLRPQFNQVVRLWYISQSFWFSQNPPLIYVYDLDYVR